MITKSVKANIPDCPMGKIIKLPWKPSSCFKLNGPYVIEFGPDIYRGIITNIEEDSYSFKVTSIRKGYGYINL